MNYKPSLTLARPRGKKEFVAIYIGEDAVAAQLEYDRAVAAPAMWDFVQLYVRPIERRHRLIEAPPAPPAASPSSAPPSSIPERGRRGR
jgi:hypothetical protein